MHAEASSAAQSQGENGWEGNFATSMLDKAF